MTEPWATHQSAPMELMKFSLACLAAGEQSGRLRAFHARSLTSHGLVVVTSGSGTYTDGLWTNGRPVSAPALIWLYPGKTHGYSPNRGGWSEHWILYGGPAARVPEGLGLVSRKSPVMDLAAVPDELVGLFSSLRATLPSYTVQAQLEASTLVQRVIQIAIANSRNYDHAQIEDRVVALIEATATENRSVAERANRIGLSTVSMRRALKEATGLSAVKFVAEVRLTKARELLADTELSVATIAAEVGYSDAAYFSRFFSRQVGISPSGFRRQQQRSLGEEGTTDASGVEGSAV